MKSLLLKSIFNHCALKTDIKIVIWQMEFHVYTMREAKDHLRHTSHSQNYIARPDSRFSVKSYVNRAFKPSWL